MKRPLTYILTMALLIEGTGAVPFKSEASAGGSALRPMASAIGAAALRKELTWIEGVAEVPADVGPHGDKEVAFFGEDSGGGITHIRFARYNGIVYRAKIVLDEVRNGEERFIIPQAEILNYLNSLNISGIAKAEHFLEVDFADGKKRKVILFEDFGKGKTLYDRIEGEGDIPEAEAVDIMLKVSHIVSQLHKAGVYHWDIKPSHVWITDEDEGEVIIFDFDTAFMTKEEFVGRELYICGTAVYRSQNRYQWRENNSFDPEGEGFSPAKDEVYSLGMTLIDILIRDCIIGPGTPEEWARFKLMVMENTGISQGLKGILYKAISEGRSDYKTVDEFIAALEEYSRQRDAGPSSEGKSSSAGAYWPKIPGPEPENPYPDEEGISRSFWSLNKSYDEDISREIERRIEALEGRPLKILLIGAGRGFEAFGLMKEYGDKVDITATNLEDLLYRDAEELKERFTGSIKGEVMEPGGKTEVDTEEAQGLIDTLRSRYIRYDADREFPLDEEYDMVILGEGTFVYTRRKWFALQEAIRICREGGVVYTDLAYASIKADGGEVSDASYHFSCLKDPNITSPSSAYLKIAKNPSLSLPEVEEIRSMREQKGEDFEAPRHKVLYRLIGPKENLKIRHPSKVLTESLIEGLNLALSSHRLGMLYNIENIEKDLLGDGLIIEAEKYIRPEVSLVYFQDKHNDSQGYFILTDKDENIIGYGVNGLYAGNKAEFRFHIFPECWNEDIASDALSLILHVIQNRYVRLGKKIKQVVFSPLNTMPARSLTELALSTDLPNLLLKNKFAKSPDASDITECEFILNMKKFIGLGSSKSSSAGIYWPKVPGPELWNPYGDKITLEGDFEMLDFNADHDISKEIELRMGWSPFAPVKILIIGVGRGFEAFELMKRYGDRVNITVTNKEDLLSRRPAEIVDKLSWRYNDITEEEAQEYIAKLRSQYLRCDLDEGLPFEANQYDIVIYGGTLSQYLHKKYPAIKEAIRVCKEWGVAYADADGIKVGGFEDDIYFFAIADKNIIPLHSLTKFIKTGKLILPELNEYRYEEYTRFPAKAIIYKTYYNQVEPVKIIREDMCYRLCQRLARDAEDFIKDNEQEFREHNFTIDCLTHCYEFKRRFDRLGLDSIKCEIYSDVREEEHLYNTRILITGDNYLYVVDIYPEDSDVAKIEKCSEDFDIESLGHEISYWEWQPRQVKMWNELAEILEENYHPGLLAKGKASSAGQQPETDESLRKLFDELNKIVDDPGYINKFTVRIDFFKEEEKRQAEHILDVDLDKLETDMVRLLSGIFSRLSEGEITIRMMRELFGEQESRIFELMQEIKIIRIKLSALKGKYKQFLLYTRVDTPDCGLCFYGRDYIIEAAEWAGFEIGYTTGEDLYEVLVRSNGKPVHTFMAIRGNHEEIALDLYSRQITKVDKNCIIVQPLASYMELLTQLDIDYYARTRDKAERLKAELLLAKEGFPNVIFVFPDRGSSTVVFSATDFGSEKRALERIKSSA